MLALLVLATALVADAAPPALAQAPRLYVLAYAPDGQWLAGMSDDGQIRFWNTADGAPIRTIATDVRRPRRLLVTPDGLTMVVVADSEVSTWSIRGRTGHRFPMSAFEGLSVDGAVLVGREPLQLWDLRTGEKRWAAPFVTREPPSGDTSGNCTSASALAPDLRRGLTLRPVKTGVTAGDDVRPLCASCNVSLWNVADAKPERTLALAECPQQRPAFDEDGRHVIVGAEGAALIWDVEDRTASPVRLPVAGTVKGGLSAGHLRRILLWGPDWVGVWDSDARRLAWRFDKERDARAGFTVALSSSAEYVATVGWTGSERLTVWTTATGRRVLDADSAPYLGMQAVAFEPHGRALAYLDADGRPRIKPLAAGR
jgi:WD40 repeat protein